MATWPASVTDADRAYNPYEIPEVDEEYFPGRLAHWADKRNGIPLYELKVHHNRALKLCTAHLYVMLRPGGYWRQLRESVVDEQQGIEGAVRKLRDPQYVPERWHP